MKLTLLVAMASLALAASPASAGEALCFQNQNYLVIGQERLDDVGMEFIIRPPAKGKIACVYEEKADDVLIGDPADPLWFEGLAGQYLVLTRSTGPDGNVVIYDLAAPATPMIDLAADDEITVADDRVTYWARTETGTANNCPEYAEFTASGLGAVVAEEQVVDVATGQATPTGRARCSATQ